MIERIANIAGACLAEAARGETGFDPAIAFARDITPAGRLPGPVSAGGKCRLLPCLDGWLAVSLARAEDVDAVPAWLGIEPDADVWSDVAGALAQRSCGDALDRAILLHLPVARVGEAVSLPNSALRAGPARGGGRVIDFSALWAGPYCGALLAEAGWEVIRIESPSRPDPTAATMPDLDRRLNGRKRRVRLPVDKALGLIAEADMIITSGRPHALARLGLSEAALAEINPGLLWIAITAHGWRGPGAMRVGFGDDCAAAGGLVEWADGVPLFIGDALADPLTGIMAATLAIEAAAAGQTGVLDVPLAGVAAHFAQAVR